MYAAVIRTVVPLVVGALVTWGAKAGLNLDADALATIVTVVVGGVYYAVARWLELHVSPTFGRVFLALGLTKKVPAYVRPVVPVK